ncbi:uncharacterized protein LOC131664475 [Phymastichus coffea]|uniref:uncharacterized protein LOC131664475 n=1 Tax=Phymastichus coffea TaxID=108790 RepID=UPI00273C1B56|nr:uncharacterized protein LOC131664475 [Phymastichus coffea]
MDALESIYYVRCNRYLRFCGQWPHQETINRVINSTLMALLCSTVILPQFLKLYQLRNDFGMIILGLPSLLFYAQFAFKNIFCAMKTRKIRAVLDMVQRDFRTFEGEEIEVIREYSAKAYKINTLYTAYMYTAVAAYSTLPLTLHVADVLFPLAANQTRLQGQPRLTTFLNEKLDNSNFFVIIHGMAVDMTAIVFIIGFDTLYFALAYHACALFNVVTCRIMRGTIDRGQPRAKRLDTARREYKDVVYGNWVETILLHKYVLESVAIIESAFSALNLLSIACAMLPLTLTGFQVIANKNQLGQMLRFLMFALGEIVHLFYYNWPGQKITDHGWLVYKSCYATEWYGEAVSDECRKLMKLVILRSQKPCHLTAGKLYILGLENFAAIVKVSMSYFTVLSSLM